MDRDSPFFSHAELEYDPRYSEIDFALARLDSMNNPLAGDEVQESVQWKVIADQCQQLLQIGFDWRVVLWLLRAQFTLQGCSALWLCLRTLEQAISQLPAEDEARASAATGLSWLASHQCLSGFKHSLLAPNVLLSMEQLQQRGSSAESADLNYSEQVSAQEAADKWFMQHQLPPLHQQLHDCLCILDRLTLAVNHASQGYLLSSAGLHDYLQTTLKYLTSLTTTHSQGDESGTENEHSAAEPLLSPAVATLQSRRDVIVMLDKVLDYFAQYEPSHPAPVLIRRSQKMIGMDFAAIVEELLPEALQALQQYAGKP